MSESGVIKLPDPRRGRAATGRGGRRQRQPPERRLAARTPKQSRPLCFLDLFRPEDAMRIGARARGAEGRGRECEAPPAEEAPRPAPRRQASDSAREVDVGLEEAGLAGGGGKSRGGQVEAAGRCDTPTLLPVPVPVLLLLCCSGRCGCGRLTLPWRSGDPVQDLSARLSPPCRQQRRRLFRLRLGVARRQGRQHAARAGAPMVRATFPLLRVASGSGFESDVWLGLAGRRRRRTMRRQPGSKAKLCDGTVLPCL